MALRGTVSSHNFNSEDFKLRVPDPRTIAQFHSKMPFEGSNLSGAGHVHTYDVHMYIYIYIYTCVYTYIYIYELSKTRQQLRAHAAGGPTGN